MTESTPETTFEAALEALEARVASLESGEVPLDQALVLFEEGMAFAETCHDRLAAAEARIAALTRTPDGVGASPLDEPEPLDG